MRTKIIWLNLLLFFVFVSLAATPSKGPASQAASTLPSDIEALSKKMSENKFFQEYYVAKLNLANTIIETKSQKLYDKIAQNQISKTELELLFKNFTVSSRQEFDQLHYNSFHLLVQALKEHKELKVLSGDQIKLVVVNAFKLIYEQSSSLKFKGNKNITLEECWWHWVGCEASCGAACTYDENYSGCMQGCSLACSGLFGVCWAIAE